MAKEIDLIMSPGAAPAELKTAVDNHKKNYDLLKKAETKMAEARVEVAAAQLNYDKTEVIFRDKLTQWSGK